jgi:hypothetical protein
VETEAGEQRSLSPPTKWFAWTGNDMVKIDPSAAEKKLRGEQPKVFMSDEVVEMAFKVGRDKAYFTNKRIIYRPKGVIQSKKTEYKTITYASILAFAVETAGRWPDMDTKLKLWTGMPGLSSISFSFRKGTRAEKPDVMLIHKFIMGKVMGPDAGSSLLEEDTRSVDPADVLHWLGNNAAQIDADAADQQFRKGLPGLLRNDESVQLAFRVGEDTTLFTSRRVVIIDANWLNMKQVQYKSIPYSSIKAFAVQSAGSFDSDSEIMFWTDIKDYSMNKISMDLRKGRADIFAVQRLLSGVVLKRESYDSKLASLLEGRGLSSVRPSEEGVGDILAWLGDDFSSKDPVSAETDLRSRAPGVLLDQDDERVEMAFKVGRDKLFLTTRRLLSVDVKGISGKKVEFLSLPYSSISAFQVASAGDFDTDSEFMVWTTVQPPPPPQGNGNDPPPPPPPGMTYLSFDLRRGRANIFAIQNLLSDKVLGLSTGASLIESQLASNEIANSDPADLWHWLGNNAREIDPRQAEAKFGPQGGMPILQSSERVEMAFKVGRDYSMLTSKRVILMDKQGFSGKKVSYKSIPWRSIGAYGVSSAGSFDSDAEFMLYTPMPWLSYIKQDLRKDTANIEAIQRYFSKKLLDVPQMSSLLESASATNPLDWLGGNAKQINPEAAEEQLRTNPPILLRGEHVEMAFKVGRDSFMLTTSRVLQVDVQGVTGKKIEYKSIPYNSVVAYAVQTAGNFGDRDEEIYAYTSMPSLQLISQDVRKGKADLFAVYDLFNRKVVR